MTHLGISPKYLHALKDHLKDQAAGSTLDSHGIHVPLVRVITSTGSVLSPELFRFVYRQISRDVMLSSITGAQPIIIIIIVINCHRRDRYYLIVCRRMSLEASGGRRAAVRVPGHAGAGFR